MQDGGQAAGLQRESRTGQADHAGTRLRVACRGFVRGQRQGLAGVAPLGQQHRRDGAHLDGIAQWRARAVQVRGMHHGRRHVRGLQRGADQRLLRRAIGRRQAAGAPVLIERRAVHQHRSLVHCTTGILISRAAGLLIWIRITDAGHTLQLCVWHSKSSADSTRAQAHRAFGAECHAGHVAQAAQPERAHALRAHVALRARVQRLAAPIRRQHAYAGGITTVSSASHAGQ